MSLEQSNPLVTVYIPTFNRVELLKRAVESVRQQTYQNLEIIIVDDCSQDGTHEYLEEISKQDSRIRYFIKEKNSGACVSRNIAIENAKGEFITGLDDDDYFLENRIFELVKYKYLLEEYIFINTRYLSHFENGSVKKSFLKKFFKKVIKKEDLLYFNTVGNQIFTRTKTLKECLFDVHMPAWQDLHTWYLLLNNGGRACTINSETYVIDTTHPHERLTLQKKEKILEAYNIFIRKFKLNNKQKKILFTQLQDYNYEIKYFQIIFLLISKVDLFTIILTVSRLKKKVNSI